MKIVEALSVFCALCASICVDTDLALAVGTTSAIVRETPQGGEAVIARKDGEGKVHLIFKVGTELLYAKSADDGSNFSAPLRLVDPELFPKGLEFVCWDMAIGQHGRIHMALGTNAWKLKRPKEEWGFYYTTLDAQQAQFKALRNINHQPSEGYSLATDAKGRVTACWLADKLYANVSTDNGETFGANVEIDPTLNPCNCCTTNATYGADGKLAVLYREETNNERDMYLVLWDHATRDVSRHKVSSTPWKLDTCPMTYYCVLSTSNGYVAAWPTQGRIYFTELNRHGTRSSIGEVDTLGYAGHRTDVRALQNTKGQTMIVWKHEGKLNWRIYGAKFDALGPPESITSAGNSAAAIVSESGELVVFN